jgi:hypothetical protein
MLIKELDDAPELELISDDDDADEEVLEAEEVGAAARKPVTLTAVLWGALARTARLPTCVCLL